MADDFLKELGQLVRARYSLLYVVTWEEQRALSRLVKLAESQDKTLFEWSVTDGLRKVDGGGLPGENRMREPMALLNHIMQTEVPSIFVLKDFHTYLESNEVVRQLRDLAQSLRRSKKTIVILSPILTVPPELEKQLTIIDLPLPTFEELQALLNDKIADPRLARNFRIDLKDADRDALAKAAQGLTMMEAENAFALAIVRDGVLDISDIEAIVAEKKQIIRKSELLEYYDVADTMSAVGGMKLLKDWLRKRSRAFTEEARRYGLPEPRGILLLGVQGCGKSLVAKTIAQNWRLPLLRLDMSRIFQGYIGSSEQNMRRALKVAESLAPVVLWVDEVDKAFAGSGGSGSSDSGTTARVVGTFLTWLQEKTSPVFVVATANEVHHLPPELLRKGRLDEIFFVDLPRGRERAEIFHIHLRKMGRDPSKFDLRLFSDESKGFSGAEIEQAILSAMYDSFYGDRELSSEDIVISLKETVPLYVTMREKIEQLRSWATDRARPVSTHKKKNGHETNG
jgi:SpoVK/Ycf46/Vps4 family AAA+-type ATPase